MNGGGEYLMYKKYKILLSAICLALIVTIVISLLNIALGINRKHVMAESLLSVTCFTLTDDSMEEIELKESILLPREADWTMAINVVPGLPLELSYPDEYVNFTVRTSDGVFRNNVNGESKFYGKEVELPNNSTIYWNNLSDNNENELLFNITSYLDIIIRSNEHIVGYAVIKIYPITEFKQGHVYSAKMLKSVSFPKVDGEYQNISLDFIESEILNIKSKDQS